jgi:predicted enzyme related to lactoylglutathione lyase
MSHTIIHFEIPADDPEKLAGFYTDLFDWKIEKLPGEAEYWSISTVAVDDKGRPVEPGVNGGMTRRQVPQQTPINYVSIESLDESLARAKALGATIVVEKMAVPGMGWFAQLIDPQGNPFAVFEEAKSITH